MCIYACFYMFIFLITFMYFIKKRHIKKVKSQLKKKHLWMIWREKNVN